MCVCVFVFDTEKFQGDDDTGKYEREVAAASQAHFNIIDDTKLLGEFEDEATLATTVLPSSPFIVSTDQATSTKQFISADGEITLR